MLADVVLTGTLIALLKDFETLWGPNKKGIGMLIGVVNAPYLT